MMFSCIRDTHSIYILIVSFSKDEIEKSNERGVVFANKSNRQLQFRREKIEKEKMSHDNTPIFL